MTLLFSAFQKATGNNIAVSLLALYDCVELEKQHAQVNNAAQALAAVLDYARGQSPVPPYLNDRSAELNAIRDGLSAMHDDRTQLLTWLLELARPLKDFSTEWERQLTFVSLNRAGTVAANAQMPVQFNGSAEAQMELDVYNREDARDNHQLSLRDSECALRLGFDGKLASDFATNAIRLPNGQWSVSAAVELDGAFDVFVPMAETLPLYQALPLAMSALPVWGDLESAMAATQSANAPLRLQLASHKAAQIGGKLSVGKSWQHAFASARDTLADLKIGADLSATIDFMLTDDADNEICVETLGVNRLAVRVERGRAKTSHGGLELDAGIQLLGTDRIADRLLDQTDISNSFLQTLNELRDPRAYLCEELKTLLNAGERKELLELALGLTDVQTVTEHIEQQLYDRLLAGSGKLSRLWSQPANEVSAQLLAELNAALGGSVTIPDVLRQSFEQKLQTAISNAQQRAKTKVDAACRNVAQQAGSKLAQWLQPLAQFGERVTQAVQSQRWQDAIDHVFDWIDDYNQKRQKLAEAIAQISKREIALQLKYAIDRAQTTQRLASFHITAVTNTTRTLYRQCLNGDFRHLPALLNVAQAEGSIGEVQYLFDRQFNETRALALNIDLFGVQLAWTETAKSSWHWRTERDKLLLASAKNSVDERYAFLRETRSAEFANSEACLAEDQTLQSALSLYYSYSEEALSTTDAREFGDSLVATELVSKGFTDNLFKALDGASARQANQWRNASVNLTFLLSPAKIDALLSGERAVQNAVAVQLDTRQKLNALRIRDDAVLHLSKLADNEDALSRLANEHRDLVIGQRELSRAESEIVKIIASNALSWKRYLFASRRLRQEIVEAVHQQRKFSPSMVNECNKTITSSMLRWVSARDITKDDRLPWRFAALLRLFASSVNDNAERCVVVEVAINGRRILLD